MSKNKEFVEESNDVKAIKDKLSNLLRINPRDYCIRTKIGKNHFDLFQFFTEEEVNNFIENKSDLAFSTKLSKNDFVTRIKESNNPEEVLHTLESESLQINKELFDLIIKDLDHAKKIIISKLAKKVLSNNKKLIKISQKAKEINNDRSTWTLFLGTWIFQSKLEVGSFFAPLVFYPVEIVEENSGIHLKKKNREVIVNEKLISYLKRELHKKFDDQEILSLKTIEEIKAKFRELFSIDIELDEQFTQYEHFGNDDITIEDSFVAKNQTVVGIFEPLGGKLKSDLNRLIEKNINPFNIPLNHKNVNFVEDEISKEPLFEIGNPLNIYQRYAVRSSLEENTVIFGPPGTGKSEVISNIIANILIRQKNTLVISEKKAALDVLYERLGEIGKFALFLYDLDKKEKFYDKIKELGEKVSRYVFNSKTKTEEIDIRQEIINTKEFVEFNNLRNKIKNISETIIDFYKLKSLSNDTYSEYVDNVLSIEKQILNFARSTDFLADIEFTNTKYNISNVQELFTKLENYKHFLASFNLTDIENIEKQLMQEKINLVKWQVEDNFINHFFTNYEDFKIHHRNLTKFIKESGISKDENLMEELKNDNNILWNDRKVFAKFYAENAQILNENKLLSKLQNAGEDLEKLIMAYEKKADSYPISHFIKTGEIKVKLLKSKDEYLSEEELKIYDVIKKFSEINRLPSIKYHDLSQEQDFLAGKYVKLFFNEWLLANHMKELFEKDLIFFDHKSFAQLSNININDKEFAIIKRILDFENKVLDQQEQGVLQTDINLLISDLKEKNKKLIAKVEELVVEKYYEAIKIRVSQADEASKKKIKEILQISNNEGRLLPPIQKFVVEYLNELRLLFPIWISKPEIIAEIIPLEKSVFDYGIFDEASQMFLERSYPLVYRADKVIVAGDDKQLKPTSFFANKAKVDDEDYKLSDMDQVDSLLDRARVSLWNTFNLKNHYRSSHKDLIAFSNEYIYNDQLKFATYNGIKDSGIEVIDVNGVWDDVNRKEAETVIKQIIKYKDQYEKIIVVTFGIKQSEYIEQLLFNSVESKPDLYDKYIKGNIVLTNLENVQGNESDLVILSVSYAKNPDGILRTNFGPLITYGGANRLNVAITRAKKKLIIVKSIYSDEVSINTNNPNALVFKSFITYCDTINKQNEKNSESIKKFVPNPLNTSILSKLEEILEHTKGNYIIKKNLDIGSSLIDFAIYDQSSKKVKLAVMLGNTFSKIDDVVDAVEKIDTYFFIQDRGFPLFVIEQHEWINNTNELCEKIKKLI